MFLIQLLKIVLTEVLLVLMVLFFSSLKGTSYGFGVYFSSDPIYSNQFAKPNPNGEKSMFISRVLI